MSVKERSFRIGCGKYIQGNGILEEKVGKEIARLGEMALIIGDDTALNLVGKVITKSIVSEGNNYEVFVHNGSCSHECAEEIAKSKVSKGYDVIVGVGGGVIMDFAKLCGYYAMCPVINIPTSSATCAAYTPLSVCYTPEGRTVGTTHFDYEVDAVITDTAVVGIQPVRLMLAGVFDALAKFVEIKQRFREDSEVEYPLGLDYAYVLSKQTFHQLTKDVKGCLEDMEQGVISKRLESLIFTSIAVTGVISGIARGSNQCALAHKFYETTRVLFPETAKPYLHGEIVGVGLLLQNYFNDEIENNVQMLELMKEYNMPYRVADVGVDTSKETFEKYYELLCVSSAVDETNEAECEKLREAMEYLWSI